VIDKETGEISYGKNINLVISPGLTRSEVMNRVKAENVIEISEHGLIVIESKGNSPRSDAKEKKNKHKAIVEKDYPIRFSEYSEKARKNVVVTMYFDGDRIAQVDIGIEGSLTEMNEDDSVNAHLSLLGKRKITGPWGVAGVVEDFKLGDISIFIDYMWRSRFQRLKSWLFPGKK